MNNCKRCNDDPRYMESCGSHPCSGCDRGGPCRDCGGYKEPEIRLPDPPKFTPELLEKLRKEMLEIQEAQHKRKARLNEPPDYRRDREIRELQKEVEILKKRINELQDERK